MACSNLLKSQTVLIRDDRRVAASGWRSALGWPPLALNKLRCKAQTSFVLSDGYTWHMLINAMKSFLTTMQVDSKSPNEATITSLAGGGMVDPMSVSDLLLLG